MAEKKETPKKETKTGEGAIKLKKNVMFWLPFATWVIGAALVTVLLFFFYNPSPTISVTYFVIVMLGFYILWRSRSAGRKRGKEG